MQMGLFDNIASGVLKGVLGQVETQALPAILTQILGRTDLGSIGGLLTKLQQGGLDAQVASWLGNGSNLPVSVDQLRSALGNPQLRQLAQATGLPIDDLLATLSQHLPATIDHISPNGKLEEDAARSEAAGGSLADQAGAKDING
jgi:uncharacterized protein YidB (DUF937 family)